MLAYSSVSQMGFIATVLGMALRRGQRRRDHGGGLLRGAPCPGQGCLFLAVGVAAATGARRLWPVLLPAAVLALGFGGLPLTGGYVTKLAVKAPLGEGVVGLLATVAAAGSTLLMLHYLHRLRLAVTPDLRATSRPPDSPGPGWRWHSLRLRSPGRFFFTAGIGTSGGCAGAVDPLDSALAGAARRGARGRPAPVRAPSATCA